MGECEVRTVEIKDGHGNIVTKNSGVHIKKCRYLDNSRCVGMCINMMCKLPTQDFFTKKFGIPLTMTPNFDDFSCEMVFGQTPPPLETEDAYHQPCLMMQCTTAKLDTTACPKISDAI